MPIEQSKTINEFCEAERFSRSHFYKLLDLGQGPELTRSGKRVTISPQAHARWRRRHAVKPAAKPATPVVQSSEDHEHLVP